MGENARERETIKQTSKRERETETETERQTDGQTDIGFVASMSNYHQGHFKVQQNFN